MSRPREIGEFRIRNFVAAIVIFFLFGMLLYRMFDFHADPKPTVDLVRRTESLEQQITTLEGAIGRARSELEQSKSRWKICCKLTTPKKDKLCPCEKP
jgi:membrane protein implicated in regulation of membrane protease activity